MPLPRPTRIWFAAGLLWTGGAAIGWNLPHPTPEPEQVTVATFKAGDRVPSDIATVSNAKLTWAVDAVGLKKAGHWQLQPVFDGMGLYNKFVVTYHREESCLMTLGQLDEDSVARVDFNGNKLSCSSPYVWPEKGLSISNFVVDRRY